MTGRQGNMKVKPQNCRLLLRVKRAVDKVYELTENRTSPICTLGPVIHNEEVVSDLEKKGCEGSYRGGFG